MPREQLAQPKLPAPAALPLPAPLGAGTAMAPEPAKPAFGSNPAPAPEQGTEPAPAPNSDQAALPSGLASAVAPAPVSALDPVPDLQERKKKSAPTAPAASLPYSIVLGHFREHKNALAAAADFNRKGSFSYVTKVKGDHGEWWRVMAGAYPNRKTAAGVIAAQKLKKALVLKTPFAVQVGHYGSRDEMSPDLQRLADSGYLPYVVQDNAHALRLLIGAFDDKETAAAVNETVAASGFACQVVTR